MGFFHRFFEKKEKPTLQQDITTAKNWIAAALNSSGYQADFTLQSLKEIDRFFDEQKKPGGLLGEELGRRLFAIGCYIGTVIISEFGGQWITDDRDPQGEINIAVRLENGSIVFPVRKAMMRFQNSSEDGIYAYVSLLK